MPDSITAGIDPPLRRGIFFDSIAKIPEQNPVSWSYTAEASCRKLQEADTGLPHATYPSTISQGIEPQKLECYGLKSKISTSMKGGKVKLPSAFTEKGLYMPATILRSPKAVQATPSQEQ